MANEFARELLKDWQRRYKTQESNDRISAMARKMKEAGYYIVATSNSDDFKEKVFEIDPEMRMGHIRPAVNYVRGIMKEQGFCERWFDFHRKTYFGVNVEVCDYLYFVKLSKTEVDEYGDPKHEEEKTFWFDIERK